MDREQKRLEIYVNIGRPKEFLSNELNTRQLRTRAIPLPPSVVPPRSSLVSVPLDRVDRLANDEGSDYK